MPLVFRDDASVSRAQLTGLVRGGLADDSYFSRDDVDQLIAIRMQLAPVWWIAAHGRDPNHEPVAEGRRTRPVLDGRHA
jgi:hypothetical protein